MRTSDSLWMAALRNMSRKMSPSKKARVAEGIGEPEGEDDPRKVPSAIRKLSPKLKARIAESRANLLKSISSPYTSTSTLQERA